MLSFITGLLYTLGAMCLASAKHNGTHSSGPGVAGHNLSNTSAYVDAINNFAYLFMHPEEIIESTSPSPFSENVTGRVDISTTFTGQTLNNEYFFGVFYVTKLQNLTQLIGFPVGGTLQELVVQPPMAYASFVFNYSFPTLEAVFPLQWDFVFRFDDDLLISEYDCTVRRIAMMFEIGFPVMADQIRIELNTTNSNDTEVIAQRAAIDTCNFATQYCVGDLLQYDSYDACYSFLTAIPFGNVWDGGMNNTWCRYIHHYMVALDPQVHCVHVGPTGGDMCIPRSYFDIVEDPPYNKTLIADRTPIVVPGESE